MFAPSILPRSRRVILLLLPLILGCYCDVAAADGSTSTRPPASCESPQAPFSSGSLNCWNIFEQAMQRNDYAAALEAVRAGCMRYRRADYCMFLERWDATPESVRRATTSAERYAIRAAAERAADIVTTADIEDAEGPVHAAAAQGAGGRLPQSKRARSVTPREGAASLSQSRRSSADIRQTSDAGHGHRP